MKGLEEQLLGRVINTEKEVKRSLWLLLYVTVCKMKNNTNGDDDDNDDDDTVTPARKGQKE